MLNLKIYFKLVANKHLSFYLKLMNNFSYFLVYGHIGLCITMYSNTQVDVLIYFFGALTLCKYWMGEYTNNWNCQALVLGFESIV